MNMNALINMFTRMIARKAMNWGINKGINSMSRKDDPSNGAPTNKPQSSKQKQEIAKRMRNLNRMTRR